MEIKLTSNVGAVFKLAASQPRPALQETANDSVAFDQVGALDQGLKATPEARPEQVARAKSLIADPDYPSRAVMGRVAELLASKIVGSPDSSQD